MAQHVALFGLGVMGSGLAHNLLAKEFPLTVWNRTSDKAQPFFERGAQVANTPREAGANADVIIAVLGDDSASRNVWTGDDGALSAVKPGTILVECSTVSPVWISELARLAGERGCSLIDAPMAGSRDAALNAKIGLFVGGDAAVIEQARPVLEAISNRVVHLGESGSGASWKLINNMLTAVHTAALAEALALAEAMHMDMTQVATLITNSGSNSGIVQAKMPRMLESRFDDTEFALKWMEKDAAYAIDMARAFGMELPTVQGAFADFQDAHDKGFGDSDFAAVIGGLRPSNPSAD